MYVHKYNFRDSKAVVTPFMQDGTYPPRSFTTLGPSELRPPLNGTYTFGDFVLQHWAGVRFYSTLVNLQNLVFLINSRYFYLIIPIGFLYPEVTEKICRVPLKLLNF